MEHFKHNVCNSALGAPHGHDEDADGYPCDTLPVFRAVANGRVPVIQSFWKPSPEELAQLNANGCVVLTIVGNMHPPVAIDVL